MADFIDSDQDRIMNYLRDDLAGRRHLATFMLHAGPQMEEVITSVSLVHAEVARSAVRPALLQNSIHPVDMVMVPDGNAETLQIITQFLYGDGSSALLVSAAQAGIVGNVLTNLLGVPTHEFLQEIVFESIDPTAIVLSETNSPPFSPSPPRPLQNTSIGSPIPMSSRPPPGIVAMQFLEGDGVELSQQEGYLVDLLQEENVEERVVEVVEVEVVQQGDVGEPLLQERGKEQCGKKNTDHQV